MKTIDVYKKIVNNIDIKMLIAIIFMVIYSVVSNYILIPKYIPILILISTVFYSIVISGPIFTNHAKELVSLIVIIATIYVMYQIIDGISGKYIIVEPFDVPSNLASNGYTGIVVANRLVAEIDNIKLKSGLNIDNKIINVTDSSNDLIIPGTNNTMKSIILSFREIFSRPMFKITGDIVSDDNKLVLTTRVKGIANFTITDKNNSLDIMVKDAAIKIYSQTEPIVLASYYHANEDYINAIKCSEISISKNADDWVPYLIIASSNYLIKKYDDAEKNIATASKKVNRKNESLIYTLWGHILRKKGEYDKSIDKFKHALKGDANNSYLYYILGNVCKLQNKYSQAISYYQKAIEINCKNEDAIIELNEVKKIVSINTGNSK